VRITGDAQVHAPAQQVWDALLDPAVLVRSIPGCERLETTGEHSYAMTVTAGVAAIRGTYTGTCTLRDLEAPTSLVLSGEGSGAPGTVSAEVRVRLSEDGDGTTALTWDADTSVGGMVAGVGQRMLGSATRRLAAEFFRNLEGTLGEDAATQAASAAEPASALSPPGGGQEGAGAPPQRVFAAPSGPPRDRFLEGVVVGAGLVASGVVLGILAGRRR
jgi:uncharacterized protein